MYYLEARVRLVVVVVEEGLEHAHVLGVRDVPVDRGEVLALRELLVQAPEDLARCARVARGKKWGG